MAIVTFRYWAAAKEAAGIAEEAITAQTLAEALAIATGQAQERDTEPGKAPDAAPGQARDAAPAQAPDAGQRMRLSAVLARSSFLVDGVPVGVRAPERVLLSDKAVVEVLPPFAGG
jgi:molybdopterin synthase sulfur carrier subunit